MKFKSEYIMYVLLISICVWIVMTGNSNHIKNNSFNKHLDFELIKSKSKYSNMNFDWNDIKYEEL